MKINPVYHLTFVVALALCSITAQSLAAPIFVQPFAGLFVVSEAGGVGRTNAFFSDLPDGSLPGNRVSNILGNFSAFDPFGGPTSFDVIGVEVDDAGSTFSPKLQDFDFAGEASVTFADSIDFDSVTFFDGDLTLTFGFQSDAFLDYSYTLFTTGLPVGSFVLFDEVETAPEPPVALLFAIGLPGALVLRRRRLSPKKRSTIDAKISLTLSRRNRAEPSRRPRLKVAPRDKHSTRDNHSNCLSCAGTRIAFTALLLLAPSILFAAPTITQISPFAGQPGDVITITGNGFTTETQANVVHIGLNPTPAPVRSATPTQLTVQVPNAQPLGRTTLTVTVERQTSFPRFFIVYSSSKAVNPTGESGPPRYDGDGGRPCYPSPATELTLVPDGGPSAITDISAGPSGRCGGGLGGRSGNIFAERGEFYQDVTDLYIPGRPGSDPAVHFTFRRVYRSRIVTEEPLGSLGHNWSHIYMERLKVEPDGSVFHIDGLDRYDHYRKNNVGEFVPPAELFTALTRESSGEYRLRSPRGVIKTFDTLGRLLEIRDRKNNFLSLQYNALSQLTRVIDSMGRAIEFGYIIPVTQFNTGRLAFIRDFSGRTVTFGYDNNEDLITVTSPRVSNTPNDNNFPGGKTTRYTYSAGFSNERLNHNLLTITRPNEVANGGEPVLINRYGTNSRSFNFDKVIEQSYGGTNASGIPVGGTFSFEYTQLLADSPSGDPNQPVSRFREIDRAGNVKEYEFNPLGYPIVVREFTKGLRANEPAFFATRLRYNADGRLLEIVYPEDNRISFGFDASNADRFQQGNLVQMVRTPDPERGGDQTTLFNEGVYEPIYQQIAASTDSRGLDPVFAPPILDTCGRTQRQRYTTRYFFDYQEADPSTILPLLAEELGTNTSEVQRRLNSAGIQLGLGDLNADGDTSPRIAGNVVKKADPSVALLASSNQADITGSCQDILTLYRYNRFGQLTSEVDPEGNVHLYEYFTESDPDGDGWQSPPPADGRTLASDTGGYLKVETRDTESNPLRNNQTDPEPTNIRTSYTYDDVGNRTSLTDGRGIRTEYFVNELNQVVQTRRAASVPASGTGVPEEPLPLIAFDYVENLAYDANDNIIQRQVEDRGDTSGTGGFVDFTYAYDILDNTIEETQEVSSAENLVTTYRYDANENRRLVTQPEGNATSFTYDERDLLFERTTGASGPRGGASSKMTYNYDGNRNVIEVVDADDTDNSSGNVSAIAGLGDATTYSFDGFDRQVSIVDAVGNRTAVTYDPADNIVNEVRFGPVGGPSPTNNAGTENALLSQTQYVHDELNRKFQEDRLLFVSSGVTTERPVDIVDGSLTPGDDWVTMRYEYDRKSRLTFKIEDDRDAYRIDYDGADRRIRVTDPESNIVESAYDDNNNIIETRDIDTAQTGAAEEVFLTTYFYDSLNRVQQQVDNIGQSQFYRYDSRNNLVAVADAQGPMAGAAISRRAFPNGPLTVNAINDFGNVTVYEYDGINRKTRANRVLTATGEGDGANIGANIYGEKTTTPIPDPTQSADGLITVRYGWDKNSLLSSLTDDHGNQTQYTYDNLNRKVTETKGVVVLPALADREDPPTTIEYEYDPDDNVVVVIDENGTSTECDFDALNRRIRCSIHRAGNEVDRRDVTAQFPAVIGTTETSFEYDGLSRMVRATDNNRPAAPEDDSVITYAYDSLNRVIEETQRIGSLEAKSISSAFEAENLRVGLVYPNNRDLTLAYDSLDRLVSVADAGSLEPLAQYAYIGTYRVAERDFPINDTLMTKAYDGLRRVTLLEHRRADGSLIVGFGHDSLNSYDRMNNKLLEEKLHNPGNGLPGNSELYEYDSAYRLVGFERGTLDATGDAIVSPTLTTDTFTGDGVIQNQEWMLDGLGNWDMLATTRDGGVESETRLDTNFNEYFDIDPVVTLRIDCPNVGPSTRCHDDNGNLTNDTRLGYRWDYRNRLVEVCKLDPSDLDGADNVLGTDDDCAAAGALPIASYAYDARNRRIRKEVAGLDEVTDFYYDEWQVVEERERITAMEDSPLRQYVYGVYIDEPLVMDFLGPIIPENPTRFFYHQNSLSSTFALSTVDSLTTNDGDLVEGYQYDAYGTQTVIEPGLNGAIDGGGDDLIHVGETSLLRNPYLYTGRRLDEETATYYHRNRYYDSETGRFLTRDSLGYVDGANPYEYVQSRPIHYIDSYGLSAKCISESVGNPYLTKEFFLRRVDLQVDTRIDWKIIVAGRNIEGQLDDATLLEFATYDYLSPSKETRKEIERGKQFACITWYRCAQKCRSVCNGKVCREWTQKWGDFTVYGVTGWYELAGRPFCQPASGELARVKKVCEKEAKGKCNG